MKTEPKTTTRWYRPTAFGAYILADSKEEAELAAQRWGGEAFYETVYLCPVCNRAHTSVQTAKSCCDVRTLEDKVKYYGVLLDVEGWTYKPWLERLEYFQGKLENAKRKEYEDGHSKKD